MHTGPSPVALGGPGKTNPNPCGHAAELVGHDARLELGLLERGDVLPLAAATRRGIGIRRLDPVR